MADIGIAEIIHGAIIEGIIAAKAQLYQVIATGKEQRILGRYVGIETVNSIVLRIFYNAPLDIHHRALS